MIVIPLVIVAAIAGTGLWIWHIVRTPVPRRVPRDLGVLVLAERYGKPKSRSTERKVRAGLGNTSQDPHAALEAALQGAWFGLEPLANLLSIDEHVYTAMGQLAGEELTSIGDLSQSLANWESAEFGSALPEGALNKLMGHLAEPVVADHLEALGMEVDMPTSSNQAGYDLILNGEHAVNVKTVADASSLSEHFEKYPDIPVVVPEDAANIPQDAIRLDSSASINEFIIAIESGEQRVVAVDPSLSHADMVEHAESVSDALLVNVDPLAVPFITLGLSGWREVKLLWKRKTDVRSAARNVSLDAAGTGLGGSAGLAAGSVIGTALLPGVGTLIGAVAGAILGALLGRMGSNILKHRALKRAKKKYEKALKSSTKDLARVRESFARKTDAELRTHKNRLAGQAEALQQRLGESLRQTKYKRSNLYAMEHEEALSLVTEALQNLRRGQYKERWLRAIPGWLMSERGTVRLSELRRDLQLAEQLEIQATALLSSGTALDPHQTFAVLQMILAVDAATPSVSQTVHNWEKRRRAIEKTWRNVITEIRRQACEHRYHCMASYAEAFGRLVAEANQRTQDIIARLEEYAARVKVELGKLGHDT